jgi:hypothetical protein
VKLLSNVGENRRPSASALSRTKRILLSLYLTFLFVGHVGCYLGSSPRFLIGEDLVFVVGRIIWPWDSVHDPLSSNLLLAEVLTASFGVLHFLLCCQWLVARFVHRPAWASTSSNLVVLFSGIDLCVIAYG